MIRCGIINPSTIAVIGLLFCSAPFCWPQCQSVGVTKPTEYGFIVDEQDYPTFQSSCMDNGGTATNDPGEYGTDGDDYYNIFTCTRPNGSTLAQACYFFNPPNQPYAPPPDPYDPSV